MNNNFYIVGLVLISLALSIYAAYSTWSLRKLRKIFFQAPDGGDLEIVLSALHNNMQNLKNQHLDLEKNVGHMHERMQFAIQKSGVVRFNPFGEDGGNFSFVLALLDNHNTGVVITSMHGRQQNRIYSKRINNDKSEVQLTEEEQQAVDMAKASN